MPVDEAVGSGFAGLAEEDVSFGSFVREDCCGGTIGEAALL